MDISKPCLVEWATIHSTAYRQQQISLEKGRIQMNRYRRLGAVFMLAVVLLLVSSSIVAAQEDVFLPQNPFFPTR